MFEPKLKREVALRLDVTQAEKAMIQEKAHRMGLSMTELVVEAIKVFGMRHHHVQSLDVLLDHFKQRLEHTISLIKHQQSRLHLCPVHGIPRAEDGKCSQCVAFPYVPKNR